MTQDAPNVHLEMERSEADRRLRDRIDEGVALREREIRSPDELEAAKSDFHVWHEYNAELLRRMFDAPAVADGYTKITASTGFLRPTLDQRVDKHRSNVTSYVTRLEAILKRLELIPESNAQPEGQRELRSSSKVFVVHGHDNALKERVARLLERLNLKPVILHEQASKGQTVVEKLETHADVGFAVVILTPDDLGGRDAHSLRPRARQNVILELGFFYGRLGRSRVCALHRGEIELPSDFVGVVYVEADEGGSWRFELAKELKASGFAVDLNKIP